MGLWWKKCPIDIYDHEEGCIASFEGDPVTIGKTWPVVWRLAQNWHCLDFGASISNGHEDGYYLYFEANNNRMVYRRVVTERYVMVRIGPEKVDFWARDIRNKSFLRVTKPPIVVPSMYSGLRGANISTAYERVDVLRGGVLWV